MTGLGIIDTDLCLWAGTITRADLEAAPRILSHPVIKAKPGPIEVAGVAIPSGLAGWICRINMWVNDNPILAGAAVVGGYLLLRRGKR